VGKATKVAPPGVFLIVNSPVFLPLPKTCGQRDNICLIGTYLVPLEPRTLLTNI